MTQISDQLLKPCVFLLQILEFTSLVGLEPAVLFPPSAVSLLGDPEFACNLRDAHTSPQMHLGFSEFVDDLLSKHAHSTKILA